MDAAAHCEALVRAQDRDRYIASLFAPDDARPALMALYAFDLEVSRVATSVSDAMLGDIRLQWWRDTLEAMPRGEAMAHPVAQALAQAITTHALPIAPLLALVDAHECDLRQGSVADTAALEAYLGHTVSAVIQLASIILAGARASESAEAAGLAGVALGIARLIHRRNLGDVIAARVLPADLDGEAARDLALRRYKDAQRRTASVPPPALPAFLPVALTRLYLSASRRDVSPLRRLITLWWSARRNRF